MKCKSFLLAISAILLLGACNNNKKDTEDEGDESTYSYTPQDISSRDVDYPTTVEKINEPSIQIHYHRNDNKYANWGLWIWDPSNPSGDDGLVDQFNYQDDFGVTASYPISKFGKCEENKIGFIIRDPDWHKDVDQDLILDLNSIIPNENVYHAYIYSGDVNIYSGPNKTFPDAIKLARFKDEQTIEVEVTNRIFDYTLYEDNTPIKAGEGKIPKKFDIEMPKASPKADITKTYRLDVTFWTSKNKLGSAVSVSSLFNSESFNANFTYDGELGAIYTSEKTTFKVWSPISSSIKLRIYENGTPVSVDATKGSDEFTEHEMIKGEKGVFEAVVNGDLGGKYYTYVVTNASFKNKEIVDPYAKSAGVNGLRGQIVDFSKTNPTGWDSVTPKNYKRTELTVWETHVADVTSHESWNGQEENRRKYLGLVEEGTTYTKDEKTVSTGFDHVKELGVNAVQLLPIFDQANDEINYSFNWGYNPLNYNVVEGLYSRNPYDGYVRVNELKTVVMKYNQADINVIMDVVYNHVNGAVGSNFDVLMPGYYYRYNDNGSLSNGSGCGNETASEMPMMRKFMIDSAVFWAREYKLGGFRFDLMGLHDLTTMNELTAKVKEVNPNIVIYGEPWAGGTSSMKDYEVNSAKQSNGNKYQGYGQFNDMMRDALIKGGLHQATDRGWVTDIFAQKADAGDVTAIKKGIAGSTYSGSYEIADPNKTVNYVTCHDNYTLFDRIIAASIVRKTDKATIKKLAVLANSVVFTSQGTAFMLAGEELLRTKNGNSNSYNASDLVNQYNYENKITYNDVFKNYQALISFKQECAQLHDDKCSVNVDTLDEGAILKYSLTSGEKEYMVIHANYISHETGIDLSGYEVVLDTLGGFEKGALLTNEFKTSPCQTIIALKK